jgi:hypothetical protein
MKHRSFDTKTFLTRATIATLAALVAAQIVTTAANPDSAQEARLKGLADEEAKVRQTIAGLQPTDTAAGALTKATAEADKPLLDAALAARKQAVEAGNAFLASLNPSADAIEIEVKRDGWIRILNELELANLALTLANDRTRMAVGAGPNQAAAAVKMPDLVRCDEERLAARKALLEANLRLRIAERDRSAAVKEFHALREP